MHSETELQLVLVLEKTISPDKNELERAQKYLEDVAASDFGLFIKMLSDILVHGGNSQVARMAAGLQLKNHLTSKDLTVNLRYTERWLSFAPDIRAYIKKNILDAIGTESCRPSSAAQCVAHVAAIELPINEWQDVIAQLVHNVVNSQSEQKKEASLEAIGYICQDLDSAVLIEQSNQILTAIIHGMRSSEPSNHVRIAATTALLNSLDFTKANFDKENERNFIMEVVCEATQSQDARISVAALQCLVKILSLYYQFMKPYMPAALFPITLEAMKSDIDDISLQGIEFWSTVCEEEYDLATEGADDMEDTIIRTSQNYARSALQFIAPVLLHKLTMQEDSDEWNPAKASSVCLLLLSNCCSNAILEFVLPFIDENIKSENWRYRDAAVMAFGSIIGGLKIETLLPLIDQALPTIIERMYDSTNAVRDTTAWTLTRICDNCPEAVINEKYFKSLVECLIHGLAGDRSVSTTVCHVFVSLSEATFTAAKTEAEYPEETMMSKYFNVVMQYLFTISDTMDPGFVNLRVAAYEAIMAMIKNAPNDMYSSVQHITMLVLEKLSKILHMENQAAPEMNSYLQEMLSLLCATIQAILKRITKEDVPKISDLIMESLLAMFASSGGKEGGIQEDALLTSGYLADALGDDFSKYMYVFKDYLIMGLKTRNNHKVCGAAVGVISDVCRALKGGIMPYCDEIMTLLLENLRDDSIDRSVKPQIFWVFGDIAMSIGIDFLKYVDIVMKMLLQASQVPMDYSDIETRDHLVKLRDSILEAYTGILMGFKGIDRHTAMDSYLQEIISFIIVVAEEPNLTDNQIGTLAGLVGDLLSMYGHAAYALLDCQQITNVLNMGRHSEVARIKHTVSWTTREMKELKKTYTPRPVLNCGSGIRNP